MNKYTEGLRECEELSYNYQWNNERLTW